MSYVRLEAWIGGEWLEVDAVSVTVMDSALTLSFEHQRTESGYRSLIWEPWRNSSGSTATSRSLSYLWVATCR